jgi:hypothetical protein
MAFALPQRVRQFAKSFCFFFQKEVLPSFPSGFFRSFNNPPSLCPRRSPVTAPSGGTFADQASFGHLLHRLSGLQPCCDRAGLCGAELCRTDRPALRGLPCGRLRPAVEAVRTGFQTRRLYRHGWQPAFSADRRVDLRIVHPYAGCSAWRGVALVRAER